MPHREPGRQCNQLTICKYSHTHANSGGIHKHALVRLVTHTHCGLSATAAQKSTAAAALMWDHEFSHAPHIVHWPLQQQSVQGPWRQTQLRMKRTHSDDAAPTALPRCIPWDHAGGAPSRALAPSPCVLPQGPKTSTHPHTKGRAAAAACTQLQSEAMPIQHTSIRPRSTAPSNAVARSTRSRHATLSSLASQTSCRCMQRAPLSAPQASSCHHATHGSLAPGSCCHNTQQPA